MASVRNTELTVAPSRIWNICMLAHVDHGKSALSDSLISANGIISTRSAGKVRYMDSREDEQRRGITMKSSSIALGHRTSNDSPLNIVNLIDSPGHVDFSGEVEVALRICDGAILVVDVVEGVCVQTVTVLRAALEYALRPILVLNKIDRLFAELHLNPMEAYRHIVSILEQVNVIMGLREVEEMMAAALDISEEVNDESAWKFDDKITVSQKAVSGYFSPEQGNVVFASATDGWAFRIVDFAKLFSKRFGLSEKVLTKTLWGDYYIQSKSKRIVRKKASEVKSNAKPMFVQFIMTNIHSVYDTLLNTQNDHELAVEKRKNVVDKLGLKITARDLKHRDASTALNAIMNAWLPSAVCLMDTVIEKLPNAKDAQADKERLNFLWPHAERVGRLTDEKTEAAATDTLCDQSNQFKRQHTAIATASINKDNPMVAYVAKMIEADVDAGINASKMKIRMPKAREELDALRQMGKEDSSEQKEDTAGVPMVALARILSGKLSVGDSVYVYSPRYRVAEDGSYEESTVSKAVVSGLSLLMGRGMDAVSAAGAGAVIGIHGLDDTVLKTATISFEPPGSCLPAGNASIATLGTDKEAVVRVAVEPHLPADLGKLQGGLRRLNQADPAVETFITASGEHIISTNGELHLERCLLDLRDRFAKGVRIHVSKPIVSFRESVNGGISPNVEVPKILTEENSTIQRAKLTKNTDDEGKEDSSEKGETGNVGQNATGVRVEGQNSVSKRWEQALVKHGRFVRVGNNSVWFRLTAAPIPAQLAKALDKIGLRMQETEAKGTRYSEEISKGREMITQALEEYASERETRKLPAKNIVRYWEKLVLPHVWSCGPRGIGTNLLIGPEIGVTRSSTMRSLFSSGDETIDDGVEVDYVATREIEKSIVAGFQLGIKAGPLCEEPMHGVGIFIEEINFGKEYCDGKSNSSETDVADSSTNVSLLSGMMIGWMREGVRLSLQHGNARLLEGMLHVDISVPGDVLGKTYTVIGQRRGRVLNEDMKEGVNVFSIQAYIPVAESFGFTDVLRKHTSGFAMPQMVFSHWEMIDLDPFWFAQTEEELEDVGITDTTAEHNNLSRKLMNGVRRRKGLKIDEKIVDKAEKQRTLSRKK